VTIYQGNGSGRATLIGRARGRDVGGYADAAGILALCSCAPRKGPAFRFGLELGSVRRLAHHSRMTEAEFKATVDKIMDIGRVLNHASPDDKAEIFRQLGLKLTYHPGRRLVQASVEPVGYGFFDGVQGGAHP
jgi:hypothetical protein